jgi:hypothetical protein
VNPTPIGGALLAGALTGTYFTETVDVLENAGDERDEFGHLTADWQEVDGLTDLPAAVGSEGRLTVDQRRQGTAMVRTVTALRFSIAGTHPVTTAHRLRWNGADYRVTAVFPDPTGTTTPVSAELVVPGV